MATQVHTSAFLALISPSSLAANPTLYGRTHDDAHEDLLHTLFIELFQTERSADVHSRREAERLGNETPALALREVSAHAKEALVGFSDLAVRRGFSDTRGGVALGSLFSTVRDVLTDHLLDRERSYRGTLLGMRHGVDLVRSIRFIAEASGDAPLEAYCERWLLARTALVDRVAAELAWFARAPERALEGAKGSITSRVATVLSMG